MRFCLRARSRSAKSLPGVESVKKLDDTTYEGALTVRVGPIKLNLQGKIILEEQNKQAWRAALRAEAKDRMAAGAVSGKTSMTLKELSADSTELLVDTDVNILGKIGDVKTAGAIARHLKFGFVGNEAREVLKQMGSAAEPAVIEVLNTTIDPFSRMECVKCLGDIGTMKVGVPALRAMEARLPQDAGFRHFSQMAIKSIAARGK